MRDKFGNVVFSENTGSIAAHVLAADIPAIHVSFFPKQSEVLGLFTAFQSNNNVSVTFSTLSQGLVATSYSDSSFQKAMFSATVNHVDLSQDGSLLSSDPRSQGLRNTYGFRWTGFFKPDQAGAW